MLLTEYTVCASSRHASTSHLRNRTCAASGARGGERAREKAAVGGVGARDDDDGGGGRRARARRGARARARAAAHFFVRFAGVENAELLARPAPVGVEVEHNKLVARRVPDAVQLVLRGPRAPCRPRAPSRWPARAAPRSAAARAARAGPRRSGPRERGALQPPFVRGSWVARQTCLCNRRHPQGGLRTCSSCRRSRS